MVRTCFIRLALATIGSLPITETNAALYCSPASLLTCRRKSCSTSCALYRCHRSTTLHQLNGDAVTDGRATASRRRHYGRRASCAERGVVRPPASCGASCGSAAIGTMQTDSSQVCLIPGDTMSLILVAANFTSVDLRVEHSTSERAHRIMRRMIYCDCSGATLTLSKC